MDIEKQSTRLSIVLNLLATRDYNTKTIEELIADAAKLEAFISAFPPEVLERRVLH